MRRLFAWDNMDYRGGCVRSPGRRPLAAGPLRALLQYALLALLGFAVYWRALWIPPTYQDDLKYLTSVSQIGNPLKYFVQDHGHGNNLYRPLTPISIWLVYQVFGVWALPNQLINLLLHITSACVIFKIVRRTQDDEVLALLASALFLVSPYTVTAATEVADRPMGLVGLFLVLLMDHFAPSDSAQPPTLKPRVSILYTGLLSGLALLAKESGVVVPLLSLVLALFAAKTMGFASSARKRLAMGALAILAAYLLLRRLIFGDGYADYGQAGYMLLGAEHYESLADLPLRRQALAVAENIGKNLLAPVFPVFDGAGRLLTVYYSLAWALPLIFSTMLLFRLGANRRNGHLQCMALATIVLGALVHSTLFRYRLQYLSQIAFCLFIVPPRPDQYDVSAARHARAIKVLAAVLLVSSTVWVSRELSSVVRERHDQLDAYRLSLQDLPTQVDEGVVAAVLDEYR